ERRHNEKISPPAETRFGNAADDVHDRGLLGSRQPHSVLKGENAMLNPPRRIVLVVALIALGGFVLGLATDIGLFGWSFAALLALYLVIAGVTQLVRGRSIPDGSQL